jgi:hypothetical protein
MLFPVLPDLPDGSARGYAEYEPYDQVIDSE